jgi:hypothetical protein
MAVWFSILQNTRTGLHALNEDDVKKVFMEEAKATATSQELAKFEKIFDTVLKKYKNKTIKY